MKRLLFAVPLLLALAAPSCADGPPADPPRAPACVPARAPIRRLTPREYENTVRDLFAGIRLESGPEGSLEDAAASLVRDPAVDGFDNNAAAQTTSPILTEQYATLARKIAGWATNDLRLLLPCRADIASFERACGHEFAALFGRRAYRRPLTADELSAFLSFFDQAHASRGLRDAIAMLIEGALQSPQFLFRPEMGDGAGEAGEAAPLTGWEIASRLSYLLWQSMPDEALFAAAERGDLATREGIESEARRLLRDPRARGAVADFHRQWLGLDILETTRKSSALYPQFDDDMRVALRQATLKYVERNFWEGDATLRGLLTDPHAYVDARLAPLYGLDPPAGEGLSLAALDPQARAGLLTQVGLLAALAHDTQTAPIKRGIYVLDKLLCAAPPAPPPGVTTTPPEAAPGDALTNRQRFEQQHSTGACASCHTSIDGIGFAFEHYGPLGEWQSTDNGSPVDASGAIVGTADADGPVDGALELSERLAASRAVHACVARKWYRHGVGRLEDEGDACAVDALESAFLASGGDLRELMITFVTSDAFRYYRLPSGLGGAQ